MYLKSIFRLFLCFSLTYGVALANEVSTEQASNISKELAECSELEQAKIFKPDDGSEPIISCTKNASKPIQSKRVDITYLIGHAFHRCEVSKTSICLRDIKYYPDTQDIVVNFEHIRRIKKFANLKSELNYKYTESVIQQIMQFLLMGLNPSVAASYDLNNTFGVSFKPYDASKLIVGVTTYHGMKRYVGYAAPSDYKNSYSSWVESNSTATPYQLFRYPCQYSNTACKTTVEYVVTNK